MTKISGVSDAAPRLKEKEEMKKLMDALVDQMLDGKILLSEALSEFEKVFIEKALERNNDHISNTADVLGIHRNTIAKRLASYNGSAKRTAAAPSGKRRAR